MSSVQVSVQWKCCTQDVVACYTTKGFTYRFDLSVLIRSQDDRGNKHFLFCPLSSSGRGLGWRGGWGGGAKGMDSTASCAQLCMNNHKRAICFTHRTSTWHNGHLGSSFNYLKTCVAAGACTCVRTRGLGCISRACTHGGLHGTDKLPPQFALVWLKANVCLLVCSLLFWATTLTGDFASL